MISGPLPAALGRGFGTIGFGCKLLPPDDGPGLHEAGAWAEFTGYAKGAIGPPLSLFAPAFFGAPLLPVDSWGYDIHEMMDPGGLRPGARPRSATTPS